MAKRRSRERVFLRDGTYYAWVPKPGGGVRKQTTNCTDKQAAILRAAELEREALDPSHAAAAKTTTGRVLDDFVQSRRRLKRASDTISFYEKKVGHLLRCLPVLARDVSHQALVEYIEQRQSEGAQNTTIKKELRAFGGAWKLARRNQLVQQPLDELMPELDDDYKPRKRFLTPMELVGLATVLPPRRMAQLAFAVATSAEYAAIGRARPEDIAKDFTACYVRGTKRETRDRHAPVLLPEQQALLKWALENADGGIGGRLFSAWPNLRNDVANACEVLGIPRCSPNDWRRTYGKWLRFAGVEPQLIGAAMGHADSKMVEKVYGTFTPDALAALVTERVKAHLATFAPRALPAKGETFTVVHAEPAGEPQARTSEDDSREIHPTPTGTYAGTHRDDIASSGALLTPAEPHEEASFAEKGSAQGRNRTADTGIFNPSESFDKDREKPTDRAGGWDVCGTESVSSDDPGPRARGSVGVRLEYPGGVARADVHPGEPAADVARRLAASVRRGAPLRVVAEGTGVRVLLASGGVR